jgi:transcriptional regulator with GAF, ATPase, and Fis domain
MSTQRGTPGADDWTDEQRGDSSSGEGAVPGAERLAGQLGELARTLEHEQSLQQTLDAIVHGATATIPGAQHASISSIRRRREVITRASTNDLPIAVDQIQYETGQGPCLDTLYEERTVRLDAFTTETRWPAFVERAAKLGAGSMLALQLFVDGSDLGALNLLSESPHAFGEDSEHIGLLFATHAAVAMAGAEEREHLRAAIDTRNLIGQAQGILMERFNIPADRAFGVLARYSQTANRKLREVAAELAATRHLGDR